MIKTFLKKLFSTTETPESLYRDRNALWALSKVDFEPHRNQEYYESPDIVDAYDFVGFLAGDHSRKQSSFINTTSFNLLELARKVSARKFLDIGCGAGVFRYFLNEYYDLQVTSYKGFDISTAQVDRAKQHFGNEFEVADASELDDSVFNGVEAIHIYSVLNFMRPERQKTLLKKILNCDAITFVEFMVTEPNIEFCPTDTYKNLGLTKIDDRVLLSQIGLCYLKDIKKLVEKSGKYQLAVTESEISIAPLYNDTSNVGAISVKQKMLTGHARDSKVKFGTTTKLKSYKCFIWPKEAEFPSAELPEALKQYL